MGRAQRNPSKNYRRYQLEGGCYFFTVALAERRKPLLTENIQGTRTVQIREQGADYVLAVKANQKESSTRPLRITSRRHTRRATALSRWSGWRRWTAVMAGSRYDAISWCPTSLSCPSRSSGKTSKGSRGWKANVTSVSASPPKCATPSPPSGRMSDAWPRRCGAIGALRTRLNWLLDVTFREDDSRLRRGVVVLCCQQIELSVLSTALYTIACRSPLLLIRWSLS
jgi:hypothetical protein